jgi:hypothetical protein
LRLLEAGVMPPHHLREALLKLQRRKVQFQIAYDRQIETVHDRAFVGCLDLAAQTRVRMDRKGNKVRIGLVAIERNRG